ncbi:TonB-dependent receptor domain-containing protein [Parvularcula sp. LCG005]|uniref:TonB-dependent receptor domain-containing protein n=1 Tax=Parvularcula sp. LCG005 TaxID=3078805 RepID=UPI0029422584|nr:TonB-dependent receptor [Parvularcula sp. LCG005]WOI54365.1 TonB-dependent receptor [Parvularcula sp. LCG005]
MFLLNRLVPSVVLSAALLSAPAFAQDDTYEGVGADDDVIVVRGALIPDEKKSTSEIASFLDAEDFDRAGDSDIAAALKRVTGLSVQDGKFIIVRGLNERYSSATLNGLPLPSPEPLRRAAPLDLFPTSVIDSTLVQKTFSPQFSGEFGGGLVELRTKGIPQEDFFEINLGMSANSATSFSDGLFYEGSNTDVYGFDDGLRDLPDAATGLFIGGVVPGDVQNAADISFEQKKTLLISNDDAPANGKGSIALGKKFYTDGDLSAGTVLYVGYDNDWQTREGTRNRITGVNSYGSDFLSTRQEVSLAGLSSSAIEFNQDHSVQLTGLLVRKSLKQADISTRSFSGDERQFRTESTDFIERQLWQAQLNGTHLFPDLADLEVAWKASYGQADRDQPYRRETSFVRTDPSEDYAFTTEEGRSNIDFRSLQDENTAAGIDFTLPLDLGTRVTFKFGGAYTQTDRSTARRLFEFRGAFPEEVVGSRADVIFSDEVLGLTGPLVRFASTAGEPDNFEGTLEVAAAYASADIEMGPYLRANIGGRFEDSSQEVATFLTRSPETVSVFDPIEEQYFLPAATLTWIPTGNFQVRGGFSKTLTRPQFRELSPSIFTDPDTDTVFVGNPFLKNTEIENYDIRAEWYFRRGEFATIGLFYKDMTNPIEDAILSTESDRTSFVNAPSAELYGVEVEFEKNVDLDQMLDAAFWSGKQLVFKTNYTYTNGEVSADGSVIVPQISGQGVTASERAAEAQLLDGSRLVGLSEHLFNIQLGIETEYNTKVTLAGNYASERTLFRGAPISAGRFLPSPVEQPPISLDFVVDQPLEIAGGEYNLTLKIQNLLNSAYDVFYEDNGNSGIITGQPVFQEYDLGRTYSISVKRTF